MMALQIVGGLFLLTYATWIFYLAVMRLKETRDAGLLGPVTYRLALPILILGYVLDFALNVTVGSILFLELPAETTVTARLKRHVVNRGWRGQVAAWIAFHLLDVFDPSGKHV